MIGIYQDSFLNYLESYLGVKPKVSSKNIVIPCPWCEFNTKKDHYHFYISLEAPIFHCFHSDCTISGSISKLFNKLEGTDNSEKYIDKEKIKEIEKTNIKFNKPTEKKKLIIPELNESIFKLKSLYLRGRLKFSENIHNVNGLIFDIDKFLTINNIKLESKMEKLKYYLQNNFIGFLSEHHSLIIFRNIDDSSDFKHFKLFLDDSRFLDYYKIHGQNYNSNHIVLGEGIFDIYNEHIFDYTFLRKNVKLYAAALSTSYDSLIKSIVFHEKIYRVKVSILSDRNISLDYYKKIKYYNSHIIEEMNIYYNKIAKDFGESSVCTEKFIL